MDDDNLEEGIDDLINQLKNTNKEVKKLPKTEEFTLKREELEQFLINKSGKLINDSMEMVENVKQYVAAAPNSEEVESLANLLKATTSSIDSLSRIFIQNKRSETSIGMKKMDIESKKELLDTDHQNKLEMSREEVLDRLIQNADIIEADIVEEKRIEDQDKS
jgi:hypothetical protein